MSWPPAPLACEDAAAAAMPELVRADVMCPLIADVLTTNALTSVAIATNAAEIL